MITILRRIVMIIIEVIIIRRIIIITTIKNNMKSFIAKQVIFISVNLRYLRFKLLKYNL